MSGLFSLSAVAYSGLSCKTGLDLGEITRSNKDHFYLFPELSTAYSLCIEISEVCGCKNLWQTAKLCKSNGTVYKENIELKFGWYKHLQTFSDMNISGAHVD